MALSTPQQLATAATCFSCVPGGEQMSVLIYLFARIAGVPLDPNILMANAKCVSCIPPGDQMSVLIALADQIANGGGSSTSCLLCGAVDPTDVPMCPCALFYQTTTSGLWYWDSAQAAWFKFF